MYYDVYNWIHCAALKIHGLSLSKRYKKPCALNRLKYVAHIIAQLYYSGDHLGL